MAAHAGPGLCLGRAAVRAARCPAREVLFAGDNTLTSHAAGLPALPETRRSDSRRT